MAVKRVLVPVDFSAESLRALAYAHDLVRRLRAELLILHVVDQTYLAGTPELYLANPEFAKLLDEQWRSCNAQLQRVAADLKREGLRVRSLINRGVPAQVIVNTAKRTGTDLIIMATHGRTGLAHALIGSVAEKVVRAAGCPVLTVRRAARKARRRVHRERSRARLPSRPHGT
jgi:nucleotide-binding universal stress UspA family protein